METEDAQEQGVESEELRFEIEVQRKRLSTGF